MSPKAFLAVELAGWIANLFIWAWLSVRHREACRLKSWREGLLFFACAAFSWPGSVPLFVYFEIVGGRSPRVVSWICWGVGFCLIGFALVYFGLVIAELGSSGR